MDITERKQAEEALRESEERYRLLFDKSPLATFVFDAKSLKFLAANQAALKFYGYTEEEFLSIGLLDIRPPEDVPLAQQIVANLPPAGQVIDVRKELGASSTHRHQRKDGSILYVEPSVLQIEFRGRSAWLTTVADITERTRAEEALRRSNETFFNLVQNAPLGVYLVDSQFRIAQVSAGAQAAFRNVRPLIGHDFAAALRIIWPEPFATEAIDRFRHTLATGESYIAPSLTHQRADLGKVESYEWQIHRVTLPDGKYGVVCYYYDSTALHQSEQRLRESEERFRSLVSVITDVPWTTDAQGAFSTPQPAWEAYTGQSWEEYRSFGWASALHPDDRERIRRLWLTALDRRELYQSDGRLWHAPGGQWRYFTAKAAPLLNTDGSVREWVGTCTDIHEVKSAEDALRRLAQQEHEARAEAENANRVKDQFLAMVSHELRTPLNAIAGWSRLLLSGKLDEGTSKRALETIDRNAAAQATIINDLLDIARIVSGKVQLNQQPLNLVGVIEAAVEVIQPTARTKGIEIVTALDPAAGTVVGDPIRLQQVIWNLLSNGVKFTPNLGLVEVKLERLGPDITIVVSDSGRGIDNDFLPHVFDHFRQADHSEKRAHDGLGLGLSIARHLIEMHGGHIQAESAGRDQGATFTLTLPLKSAAESAGSSFMPRDESEIVAHTQKNKQQPNATTMSVITVLVFAFMINFS